MNELAQRCGGKMTEFTIVNGILIKYTGDESEITIPDGVTQIVDTTSRFDWEYVGVFQSHTELTSVILPEGLQFIGKKTFKNCSGLDKIIIPNSVTRIGECAFENCTSLTEIRIPHGVTSLDLDIIRGCESLSRIYIPSSVKLLWVDYYNLPKNLKQIIIDPNTELEEIRNPEYFLKHDFEISPCPMIPISLLKEPEIKLGFFFEYCKAPEQSSAQIAAGYEKYGKSQRSRILREAEAQNKSEVLAYYEKKGQKTSERTLSPKEKAALLEKTIEKGTGEELKQVLQNYKKFSNSSEMLEKTVINGNSEKLKIMLDHGIEFPVETDCFFDMLRSEKLTDETKVEVSDICLSYENMRNITSSLVFSACVLNNKRVIEVWKARRNPDEYIRTYYTQGYNSYWMFENLSAEGFLEALHNLHSLSNPNEKPELFFKYFSSKYCSLEILKYFVENFTFKAGFVDVINNVVHANQIDALKFLEEQWKDKDSIFIDDEDYDTIGWTIKVTIGKQSYEMLSILFETGWAETALKNTDNNTRWKKESFIEAIKCEKQGFLDLLINNNWISFLPSSFSKPGALQIAVNADTPEALEILEKQGWIRTASLRDKLIDQAADGKNNNALAWLLEYKNKTADPVKEEKAREQKERKTLNTEVDKTDSVNKDDWKTSKNPDGTYGITRYSGDNLNKFLTIPAIIGKRKITSINTDAFSVWSYSNAKRNVIDSKRFIIISEGITNIETDAFSFSGYGKQRAIAIPPSVVSIKKSAIHRDSSLIIFGKKGTCAEIFAETEKIRFINNDESDKPIPDFSIIDDTLIAYYGTDKNPVIQDGIKQIGNNAFRGRDDIENIIIPSGVIVIGDGAFEGCKGLKSITIPDTVTSIGSSAFADCKELNNINIPSNVTSIGDRAFYECIQLKSITIPTGITTIEETTFWGCKGLTNITIPSNVTKISRDAFWGCDGLISITIPDTVTEIDSSAFEWCSKEKLLFLVHDNSKALEFAQLKGFKYEVIEK